MTNKEIEKVRRYSAVVSLPMECLRKDLPSSYDYEAFAIKELYRKFLDPISEELEFNKNIVISSRDENYEDNYTYSIVHRKDLRVLTLTFCKDCKYSSYEPYEDMEPDAPVYICNRTPYARMEGGRKPNFYCGYGERKESEE